MCFPAIYFGDNMIGVLSLLLFCTTSYDAACILMLSLISIWIIYLKALGRCNLTAPSGCDMNGHDLGALSGCNLKYDVRTLGGCVFDAVGGHRTCIMKYKDLSAFISGGSMSSKCPDIESKEFYFIEYIDTKLSDKYLAECYLQVKLPMHLLVQFVTLPQGQQLAKLHGINPGSKPSITQLKLLFEDHATCHICAIHVTVVSVQHPYKECKQMKKQKLILKKTDEEKQKIYEQSKQRVAKHRSEQHITNFDTCDLACIFPPPPLTKTLSYEIINAACSKLKPELLEESGCAVCGQLVPCSSLSRLSAIKKLLNILNAPGFTRQERHRSSDQVHEFPLAIDHSCHQICNTCHASVCIGDIPKMALARGLWIGQVPEVLTSLHYIEKMLVARV